MRKLSLLVVEDDADTSTLIKITLQAAGHRVTQAGDGQTALRLFAQDVPDVVLLDAMMPEMNGFAVLENLRQTSDVPVLMLTALADPNSIQRGFLLGADDYITKPFTPPDLLQRLENLTTKLPPPTSTSQMMTVGRFQFDLKRDVVEKDNKPVDIGKADARLLRHLMRSPNKDILYEELFQVGWRRQPLATDPVVNLVNIAIERLRDKIETDPKVPKHLLYVKGVGYKFDPN